MEPIKRQRKESDSVYTIMLIPHKGHEQEYPFSPQPAEKGWYCLRFALFTWCRCSFSVFAYFVQGTSGSTGTVDLQE